MENQSSEHITGDAPQVQEHVEALRQAAAGELKDPPTKPAESKETKAPMPPTQTATSATQKRFPRNQEEALQMAVASGEATPAMAAFIRQAQANPKSVTKPNPAVTSRDV